MRFFLFLRTIFGACFIEGAPVPKVLRVPDVFANQILMLINIHSAKCIGVQAVDVTVEVDISSGIGIHLVGLADAAVKESLLRTVTALQSLGFRIPGKRIVINLAPADIHKNGSGYDVPIALGILAASGQGKWDALEDYLVMGELGLDGTVRPVPGALPVAELSVAEGRKGCLLPLDSALDAADYYAGHVYGVRSLPEVIRIVSGLEDVADLLIGSIEKDVTRSADGIGFREFVDMAQIIGQEGAKRGVEVAAAGGHNVIMIGPPGSGKSSLAKAMAGILPPMLREESLETSKIYSVAGTGGHRGLLKERPFRAPHYSASIPALIGGGSDSILPGEISLAHNGVLFIDEFCEAPKKVVEALRGPMEDGTITVSRLRNKVTYPASFMLVAAANPCPCGYYGEGDRCRCTVGQRLNYLARLSGPMMDRIDIQLWMHSVDAVKLTSGRVGESSAVVRERVVRAREIQRRRFKEDGIYTNAMMDNRLIDKYCSLDSGCREFLRRTIESMGLSARACMRIIRIARTIADLEGSPEITILHLSEATGFRFMDKSRPA